MSQFSSIGIFGKRAAPGVDKALRALLDYLQQRKLEVLCDESTANHLADLNIAPVSNQDMAQRADLIIVVGGDGTLLHAGRMAAEHDVPLLGINLGRLGFMVDVTPNDMAPALDAVLAGDYVRDERLMLSTTLLSRDQQENAVLGLNDTVVRNRDFARVLEFDTYIDGQFISHHRADGIIIATPTGSTAYALSGGGPVLHPGLDTLALVPICPHTLSDRPLIVSAEHVIDVVISDDISTEALASCDGQWNRDLTGGDRVRIQRAEHSLQLIHPPGYDYFSLLRSKLGWGRGQKQRNPASE